MGMNKEKNIRLETQIIHSIKTTVEKLADQENELTIQDSGDIIVPNRQDRKRTILCYILVKMQSLEDKKMKERRTKSQTGMNMPELEQIQRQDP